MADPVRVVPANPRRELKRVVAREVEAESEFAVARHAEQSAAYTARLAESIDDRSDRLHRELTEAIEQQAVWARRQAAAQSAIDKIGEYQPACIMLPLLPGSAPEMHVKLSDGSLETREREMLQWDIRERFLAIYHRLDWRGNDRIENAVAQVMLEYLGETDAIDELAAASGNSDSQTEIVKLMNGKDLVFLYIITKYTEVHKKETRIYEDKDAIAVFGNLFRPFIEQFKFGAAQLKSFEVFVENIKGNFQFRSDDKKTIEKLNKIKSDCIERFEDSSGSKKSAKVTWATINAALRDVDIEQKKSTLVTILKTRSVVCPSETRETTFLAAHVYAVAAATAQHLICEARIARPASLDELSGIVSQRVV